jgi:drug/metabolite transporter (DMT)-like permease
MSPVAKAQWQLHFCVLLWGFTAILGKLITMPALALVWWRMLIVALCLACVPKVWRDVRRMPPRLLGAYVGVGVLLSAHWLTFYGAIKLANASVAVTCLALAPAFLSVIEPWISRSGRSSRANCCSVSRCFRVSRWWSAVCRPACIWA